MNRQLIFCLESDNKAKTDWIYIKECINKFFKYGNEVKLSPVYMAGKTNYNKPKVTKQILTFKKKYLGESIVIYCIDTDSIESDPERKREFVAIQKYCKDEKHELVWFHRDIEDVFYGEKIANNEKVNKARSFRVKQLIDTVDKTSLSASRETTSNSSNILLVLGKYFG